MMVKRIGEWLRGGWVGLYMSTVEYERVQLAQRVPHVHPSCLEPVVLLLDANIARKQGVGHVALTRPPPPRSVCLQVDTEFTLARVWRGLRGFPVVLIVTVPSCHRARQRRRHVRRLGLTALVRPGSLRQAPGEHTGSCPVQILKRLSTYYYPSSGEQYILLYACVTIANNIFYYMHVLLLQLQIIYSIICMCYSCK